MRTGFIIALAWPETLCKKAGAWYDGLMHVTGISKQNYYQVGHAAVIIINATNGNCYYFDFGRYHAPAGHGRVRDVWTDHDLKINTKALISDSGIENMKEILGEIQSNNSCHGDGQVYASYSTCDFKSVYSEAKKMQEKVFIPYGPFVWNGTNCSRFVNTLVQISHISIHQKLKIRLPWLLSPSPIGIVKGLGQMYLAPKYSHHHNLESKLSYAYQT